MKKSTVSFLLCGALICAALGGCGKTGKTKTAAEISDSYPIKTDEKLTYWVAMNSNVSAVASNIGDTEFAKELTKRTGIEIEYIHPSQGQESEMFSLMIASDELADIIEYDWLRAMGGPSKSIKDKIILPLGDYMDKYAPNLKDYLKENKQVDKDIKTDDGEYYVFPLIRSDKSLLISYGPVVRRDWLEELSLPVPESIDDWETMLKAFRDKKGAAAPLSVRGSDRYALYILLNSSEEFYVENGRVKYGPLEPEFKGATQTLHDWYKEKLLDNNYALVDGVTLDYNMLNGQSGATLISGGSGLGKWIDTMEGKDGTYKLSGAKYPKDKNGNVPMHIPFQLPYMGYGSAAISASCKNPELAAKFLDYAYSEEGHMLYNFGIEGKSYEMKDGNPVYTDEIMKNKDGLTVSQAMAKYMRVNYSGPYIQDKRYISQYYSHTEQQKALEDWMNYYDENEKSVLPPITFEPSEAAESNTLLNDVKKYLSTEVTSFISGKRSMDTYDDFVKKLKELGAEKIVEIYQKAYDRYQSR